MKKLIAGQLSPPFFSDVLRKLILLLFFISISSVARADGVETTFAANCSDVPTTNLNQMQISQFVQYSGAGYGYVAGTASWLATNNPGGNAAVVIAGIPAGSTIIAAFLEAVQLEEAAPWQCYDGYNVNGVGYNNGINIGYADFDEYWDNTAYGTRSLAIGNYYYLCSERFNITPAVTATRNGTYTITNNANSNPWGLLTASVIVVYQSLPSATNTSVQIADGLFGWQTGDGAAPYLWLGDAPEPVNFNFCGNGCATNPVTDQFTRIGGNQIVTDGVTILEGRDTFDVPGTNSPTVILTEPGFPELGDAADAVGGGPSWADLSTYTLPNTVVTTGTNSLEYWMSHALDQSADDYKVTLWLNALVNEISCNPSVPTPTNTNTSTNTVTNTNTPTNTNTVTNTQTNTNTVTKTNTDTSTNTPTNTNTVTNTHTNTNTVTVTNTNTNTATIINTNTSTNTNTPTNTNTVTNTFTVTNTQTNTSTPTFTPTNTNTPTILNTNTSTNTFTPTNTQTNTSTALADTATNTNTPTNTNTASNTATLPNTATNTDTFTPTNTQTNTSTALANTATSTNTFTATNTQTSTATVIPTNTSTNTHTATSTASSTNTGLNTATSTNTETATATSSSTATPGAFSSIGKTVSEQQALPGDDLTYTIAVTIGGNSVGSPVITDVLPPNMTFLRFGSSPAGTTSFNNNGALQWDLPSPLAPNIYDVSYVTQVNSTAPANAVLTNHAQLIYSGGPTISASAATTISGPYTIRINIYNEAGEIVRTILIQNFSTPVNSITLGPSNVITSLNGPGNSINIYYGTIFIGTWNGANNQGVPVTNGNYRVQVDNISPTGVVTSVSQNATVNRSLSNITTYIYNSAGEKVRSLYNVVADPSASSNLVNLTLSTNILRPSLAAPASQSGNLSLAEIYIQTSGTPVTLVWNGTNDGGTFVTPGVYEIEIHWNNGQGQTTDITKDIVVMPGYGSGGQAVAEPNILNAAHGMTTTFDATGVAMVASIRVNIYTVAGQLVTTTSSGSGLPQATWNAAGIASGIYFGVVQMYDDGGGLLGRQTLKVMVLR